MHREQDRSIEALMEQLIESSSEGLGAVFAGLFNLAMRIERECSLRAGHYESTPERRGYANGTRSKKFDTPAGTVTLQVPKTAAHVEPFYPQALECGRRSCRAIMLAVAEMYVESISSRGAEAIINEFGLENLSSSQISRATALLDEELAAWAQSAPGRDPQSDLGRTLREGPRGWGCARRRRALGDRYRPRAPAPRDP